jgi:hypothetical protein
VSGEGEEFIPRGQGAVVAMGVGERGEGWGAVAVDGEALELGVGSVEEVKPGEELVGAVGGRRERGRRREKRVRLTDRDRLVVKHLAVARYFTREQLWRLVFPKRAESIACERLGGLKKMGLIRRVPYRSWDGLPVEVLALTRGGYAQAEEWLGGLPGKAPTKDVHERFLNHHLGLMELYLGILGVGQGLLGGRRRTGQPGALGANSDKALLPSFGLPVGWRWVGGEFVRLPIGDAKRVRRDELDATPVLLPDAVVEFPGASPVRVLVEWETGENPLTSSDKDRRAAFTKKLERYAKFLRGPAGFIDGPTWCQKAYPDRWPVRVRFVVHSERRKANAQKVLAEWLRNDGSHVAHFSFAVQTLPEAVDELRKLRGAPALGVAQPAQQPVAKAAQHPPQSEAEERLRPGRVAVRGEQLVAVNAALSSMVKTLRAASSDLQSLGKPELELPWGVGELVRITGVYAERAKAALAAHGLKQAV